MCRKWISVPHSEMVGYNKAEMERIDKLLAPDGFMSLSAVNINRSSDGFGLGSHFDAATVVESEDSGVSKFKIINNSNEDLTVRVYWKEE